MKNVKVARHVTASRTTASKYHKEYKKKIIEFRRGSWSDIPNAVIRDREFLKKNRNKTGFYLYLRASIVRKWHPSDHNDLDLYNNYFKAGVLACSPTLKELSEAFGYKDKKRVLSWVNELEKEGSIKIDQIEITASKTRNIYVLGVYEKDTAYYFAYDGHKTDKMSDLFDVDYGCQNDTRHGCQNNTHLGVKTTPLE